MEENKKQILLQAQLINNYKVGLTKATNLAHTLLFLSSLMRDIAFLLVMSTCVNVICNPTWLSQWPRHQPIVREKVRWKRYNTGSTRRKDGEMLVETCSESDENVGSKGLCNIICRRCWRLRSAFINYPCVGESWESANQDKPTTAQVKLAKKQTSSASLGFWTYSWHNESNWLSGSRICPKVAAIRMDFWKCNFPVIPHVRLLVGFLVGRLLSALSVIISKKRK